MSKQDQLHRDVSDDCLGARSRDTKERSCGSAIKIFGRSFTDEQVIRETLTRSLRYDGISPGAAQLREAVLRGIDPEAGESGLVNHPVAQWIENMIALEESDSDLARRPPMTISAVIERLAETSGVPIEEARLCLGRLLLWISNVNNTIQKRGGRYTILPYKLHQFIAQTGSVYTTLDSGAERFITLEPGMYKPDDAQKKPIFPNVFSRITGQSFICVTRAGDRLEPREFRTEEEKEEEEGTDGYLLIGEGIWNPEEDLDYLPEAWVKKTKNGALKIEKKKEPYFPRKVWFDEYGNCSDTREMQHWGWFMRAPLLFDPSCGGFFDPKEKESTKLAMLGSEGRSTSTTITAVSVLNRLAESGLQLRDQKLLSFTDNRQDAALQAGHFNDFLQVVQLRSAIRGALENAPDNRLTFAQIGEATRNAEVLFEVLNGHDVNDCPKPEPTREIINFSDWPEGIAEQYAEPFARVLLLVKPQRDGTDQPWWQHWRPRVELYNTIHLLAKCFVTARTTKYLSFSSVATSYVFTDALFVFATDRWDLFSVVQSTLHEAWARKYSGALKQDLRYSPSDCFETFPFPAGLWQNANARLAEVGEQYHEHRKSLMLSLWLGLTDIYNLFHARDLTPGLVAQISKKTPEEAERGYEGLLELRRLHRELDLAARDAYEWDIDLGHDFHEVETLPENDRVRYTISPTARKEVLRRLLEVNHQRAAEEAKSAPSIRKKASRKGPKRNGPEGQSALIQ